MLVRKALKELPLEIEEAENGEIGLEKVSAIKPVLILLDVTMPVLDGAGFLSKLRAQGNKTPVILLTAESGSSIIGPMLAEGGVFDYVIKPFKPEQLRGKVMDALKQAGHPVELSAAAKEAAKGAQGAKPASDLLVIDDMENVAKKLHGMLPEQVKFDSAVDRQGATSLCREKSFRAVVLDVEMPDTDCAALLKDLRILQPEASFLALLMRTATGAEEYASSKGFDGYIVKPFDPAQVEEFVSTYLIKQEVLEVQENVLRASSWGSSEGSEAFFKQLGGRAQTAIEEAAAACFEDVILDLERIPPSQRTQKLLVRLAERSAELGISLRVVGGQELGKLMKQLVETASLGIYGSVDEAKAAS